MNSLLSVMISLLFVLNSLLSVLISLLISLPVWSWSFKLKQIICIFQTNHLSRLDRLSVLFMQKNHMSCSDRWSVLFRDRTCVLFRQITQSSHLSFYDRSSVLITFILLICPAVQCAHMSCDLASRCAWVGVLDGVRVGGRGGVRLCACCTA